MADTKIVTLVNTGRTVVVSGPIRIAPGQSIQIDESRIPEGLKRLIGSTLERRA